MTPCPSECRYGVLAVPPGPRSSASPRSASSKSVRLVVWGPSACHEFHGTRSDPAERWTGAMPAGAPRAAPFRVAKGYRRPTGCRNEQARSWGVPKPSVPGMANHQFPACFSANHGTGEKIAILLPFIGIPPWLPQSSNDAPWLQRQCAGFDLVCFPTNPGVFIPSSRHRNSARYYDDETGNHRPRHGPREECPRSCRYQGHLHGAFERLHAGHAAESSRSGSSRRPVHACAPRHPSAT